MLTVAFGMLFHSFLFKFYSVTGGDQGMRVLRPLLLGMEWRGGKTAFLTGPFYYYALVLFALLGLVMWRITQSPFGLHLRAIRENAGKAAYVGVQIFRMRLAAFVISAGCGGVRGDPPPRPPPVCPSPTAHSAPLRKPRVPTPLSPPRCLS